MRSRTRIDGAIARIRGGSLLTELLARESDAAESGDVGNDPLDDDALPDRLELRLVLAARQRPGRCGVTIICMRCSPVPASRRG